MRPIPPVEAGASRRWRRIKHNSQAVFLRVTGMVRPVDNIGKRASTV
jgi:hypothetical protein